MPIKKEKDIDEKFKHEGREITIRKQNGRVELTIDNDVHEVRFLKNGRPYTNAYVNVKAKSIHDYAERFVQFTNAQEKHWTEVKAEREKVNTCDL